MKPKRSEKVKKEKKNKGKKGSWYYETRNHGMEFTNLFFFFFFSVLFCLSKIQPMAHCNVVMQVSSSKAGDWRGGLISIRSMYSPDMAVPSTALRWFVRSTAANLRNNSCSGRRVIRGDGVFFFFFSGVLLEAPSIRCRPGKDI